MAVRSKPKSRELSFFPKPKFKAMPACIACGAFQPECLVPEGDGALAMCWCCAHAHVDHEAPLHACAQHECECLPEAIYPERVLADRRALTEGNEP